MSPALRGEKVQLGTGVHRARAGEPGKDETRIWCPIDGCDWTTIRPDRYVASAREAHQIAHRKGWVK